MFIDDQAVGNFDVTAFDVWYVCEYAGVTWAT